MLPPRKPEYFIKARIKVVCEELPEYTGYVSRTLNHEYGSQVVTKDLSDALVVAWDSQPSSPQVIEMTNSSEGQRWLALRFTEDKPCYQHHKYLWATFTAATGTKDKFSTIWTQNSPGLDVLPIWNRSFNGDLTPHALGEPLEVGLTLQPGGEPPHIFFCWKVMQYWGRVPDHTTARFVLEPLESKAPHLLVPN